MNTILESKPVIPCVHRGSAIYLSKLQVPDLLNHQTLMRGFPLVVARDTRRMYGVLYRVEPDGTVLVQSDARPDWSKCIPSEMVQTKEYKPYAVNGASYRIRLTINPVKLEDNSNKIVVVDPVEWLKKRNIGGVIAVKNVIATVEQNRSRGHSFLVHKATIDGIITVTDKDVLLHYIRNGVGRAKAYGCGLISLAGA